jgi:hypothetical protein
MVWVCVNAFCYLNSSIHYRYHTGKKAKGHIITAGRQKGGRRIDIPQHWPRRFTPEKSPGTQMWVGLEVCLEG